MCKFFYNKILKLLPTAPGMVSNALTFDTEKNESISKKVLVRCYSSALDSFLVSEVQTEAEDKSSTPSTSADNSYIESFGKDIIEIKPDRMESAKCAKFYPLLESLMKRGDDAALSSSNLV